MSGISIPFNRPCLAGREMEYIRTAIEAGHISGDGSFTKRSQAALEAVLGAARVLLTTSCTHALEMAGLLLEVGAGDEVILPSFTFVSTANAFAVRGAKPVFADIRPDTLNLDESQLEGLLSPRTRAIVPVHYAGVGCAMDRILEIARRHGVHVVEDNAHGLFGSYQGVALGSLGELSTLSFHETKNLTCGEGGALVINDERYVDRAEILREKGTDRSRFFRGLVDKYTWADVGSSYVPSEILSAFLLAQLEERETIQERRRRIWTRYDEELRDWSAQHGVRQPVIPACCQQSYHMYYLLMPSLEARQTMIAHLRLHGILSVFHYLPLHLSPMGQRLGGRSGQCPVTEDVSNRLLRLPFYMDLSSEEIGRICDCVRTFEHWEQARTGGAR